MTTHPKFADLVARAEARGCRVGLVAGEPYGEKGHERRDIVAIELAKADAPDSPFATHPASLQTLDQAAAAMAAAL